MTKWYLLNIARELVGMTLADPQVKKINTNNTKQKNRLIFDEPKFLYCHNTPEFMTGKYTYLSRYTFLCLICFPLVYYFNVDGYSLFPQRALI